jgi:hypothetical protein
VVSIGPQKKRTPYRVGGIDHSIAIEIEIGKSNEAVSGFLAVEQRRAQPEQLSGTINDAISVAIPPRHDPRRVERTSLRTASSRSR